MLRQRTLKTLVRTTGVGLHTGAKVGLVLRPAAPDTGIVFRRVDLDPPVDIRADPCSVGDTRLASSLEVAGVRIGTVEHLMSALCGLGIDNAWVDVDAPELPILDGSAAPFAERIGAVGLVSLERPRVELHLERAFVVEAHGARYDLRPAPHLQLEVHLEFGARWGTHPRSFSWDGTAFSTTLAAARTFTFSDWLDELRARDLIRGGSLDNAVVFEDGRVLNEGGLRFADEPARHKTLDLLGDLARLGAPLCASITAHRPGHTANAALVQRLSQELSSSAL